VLLVFALILLSLQTFAHAQNRITILNDAFGKPSALRPDWGYAALIEFEGKRILFDTGDNLEVFQTNVQKLHIDLSHLDMVILTHAHGDHTSGLRYVLAVNPHVRIYAPDDPFFTGRSLPPEFLATDAQPALPPEMRYFAGGQPTGHSGWQPWSDANITIVAHDTTIAPHLRLVALVSQKPAFKGLHEISLVLDTPKGPVVLVGCSHPGIEAIMAAAFGPTPAQPVYMLFGGLHLLQDTPDQIAGTLNTLSGTYKVQKLAIGHCTGELAFSMAQQKWGPAYQYAGLGETLSF
jgi:7,8-dihydropterin-6-yl-methyl-4-(beta-D-ribofuranosyl)aminobenzene 5'-phosphate synthase